MQEEIATAAIEAARRLGADYAEARMVDSTTESISARDGAIEHLGRNHDNGWGVRVMVNGGWGFSSTDRSDKTAVEDTVAEAVSIARASSTARRRPAAIDDLPPQVGEYATIVEREPIDVPLEERIALALEASNNLAKGKLVKVASASILCQETVKFFVNSTGSHLRQRIVETGGSLFALAVKDGESYVRTYGRGGNFHQAGYEYIAQLDLAGNALRVGQEASDLVVAPYVVPKRATVVLGSNQLGLMVHESCGHPIELDRVLGWEAAFAGTSFLTTDKLDHFTYGSPAVNIDANATLPGGLGSFGWDDEGTPAQDYHIVEDGQFVGYLSSRDTAPAIGRPSAGCARAEGWGRIPIVRMTNVSLMPGNGGSLQDLIAQVDDGYYLETPSSWSLDDKRLNFHFSAEVCYEIKNGKLGQLYKGAAYSELTPVFWGNCQAVAGKDEWQVWGFLGCAKGEPLQSVHVAHGASPALFTNINIEREG